jgi:hypothetical protein
MGICADHAFVRSELRRRRYQLMRLHHPDRGGSDRMAIRINLTYARMAKWLDDERERRFRGTKEPSTARTREESVESRSVLSTALQAGAAQLCAVALVAGASYALLRRRPPR